MRGPVRIKGGPVSPKSVPENPRWALGTRPAVLRAPALGRQSIKPGSGSSRNYGKQDPFSTLGQGDTSQTDMT